MLGNNPQEPRRLKILARLDANHHIGLAHAVRVGKILSYGQSKYSMAKYGAKANKNWELELHVMGDLHQHNDFFEHDVITHILPDNSVTEAVKAKNFIAIAADINADILLIDHPHLTKVSWDIFDEANVPTIAFDDEGGPVRADLIFNGTILDDYHNYPNAAHNTKINSGGEFALINPCFGENLWKDPDNLSLVSVIGSGDRACEWALKITGKDGPLARLASVKKTMIVGSAFPKIEQLRVNCTEGDICLHQGIDQQAMAELFRHHSMGLITGGMIVYESLAIGLPVIIFPQEENLPPEARYFSKNGCAVDLGYEGGMDMAMITSEVKKMMDSKKKRLDLSQQGRNIIDGKGMLRTVTILHDFFKGVQKNKDTGNNI